MTHAGEAKAGKARVHCMLLRASSDGDIEVLLQMHCVNTQMTQDEGHGDKYHWALPSVEAERAEDLLIQTGTAHERRLAARRAALRSDLDLTCCDLMRNFSFENFNA
jgi:hypothetical protein